MMKLSVPLVAVILAAAAPAGAVTLVDTGTPPTSITTWSLTPTQSLAAEFSLASATVIDSVFGHIRSGAGSTITIGIAADAGEIPGATLFSAGFTTVDGTLFQGVSGQSWSLAAGTYWVTFASSASNGMGQFAPNPLLNEAFSLNGTFFQSDNLDLGVRITGTVGAVPEPASWAMLTIGFGALGGTLRHRRRALVPQS